MQGRQTARGLTPLQDRIYIWSRQIHGNLDMRNNRYDATVLAVQSQPADFVRLETTAGVVFCNGGTEFDLCFEETTMDNYAVAMPRKVARLPGRRSVD